MNKANFTKRVLLKLNKNPYKKVVEPKLHNSVSGIFPKVFNQERVPKWQLPKWQLPKQKLPKSNFPKVRLDFLRHHRLEWGPSAAPGDQALRLRDLERLDKNRLEDRALRLRLGKLPLRKMPLGKYLTSTVLPIENRIYIRGEFKESLGMNFFSPFRPEREFKVYKSCKCSTIICSRVN